MMGDIDIALARARGQAHRDKIAEFAKADPRHAAFAAGSLLDEERLDLAIDALVVTYAMLGTDMSQAEREALQRFAGDAEEALRHVSKKMSEARLRLFAVGKEARE